VGVGRRRILFRHLLPNIRGEFSSLFLFDAITVLLVMGQLGIFNVFIGGTRYTPFPPLFHSMVHEWAGLLGQYRNELFTMEWWVALWPLLGYAAFIALLSGALRLLEKDPGMATVSVKPAMSRR
jgi:peptide/nickel transport system permease protein